MSKPEVWLRTNTRALAVGIAAALFLAAAGLSAVLVAGQTPAPLAMQIGGGLTIAVGLYAALSMAYQTTLPRLAYREGELLVHLRSGRMTAVPIEIVELFFMGQGASHVPAPDDAPSKSRTIVVRLAEAATDWHARETWPAWGEWREAYIIIRGTWCEPITVDLVKELNRRLRDGKRK